MGSVLNVDRHVDMLVPQIQGVHGRKGRILPELQLVDKVSTRNAVVEAKNVDFLQILRLWAIISRHHKPPLRGGKAFLDSPRNVGAGCWLRGPEMLEHVPC